MLPIRLRLPPLSALHGHRDPRYSASRPERAETGPGGRSADPRILAVLLAVWLLPILPGDGDAQTATVRTEENFRAEPNGIVVARIEPGAVLAVDGRRGQWIRATLGGWVWTPSLQRVEDGDFDLRVSADGGENLRAEPQGPLLARLEEGMLLDELDRVEGWIRVRRTAWIWAPSVRLEQVEEAGEVRNPKQVPEPPGNLAEGWRRSGGEDMPILTGPDGDTLARSLSGTEVQVLGRQGNWARVRLEGWAWLPPGGGGPPADSAVLTDVSPARVAEEAATYRGRVVAWELEFISREEAESVRTDFFEGEPYLLTRPPGSGDRFVYVALPPDRVGDVENLTPLERIVVVGRIRTGNAALTGGPIIDLLQISRSGSGSGGER